MTTFGSKTSNGWLLSIASFACQEFGWSWEHVVSDVSIIVLMLLMRQKLYSQTNGKCGFTLQDQEKIDNLGSKSWQELVEENHKKLAQQFGGI